MSKGPWNKCDECGKFIPFADFESGAARREMVLPDSWCSSETYETLCARHKRGDVTEGQS